MVVVIAFNLEAGVILNIFNDQYGTGTDPSQWILWSLLGQHQPFTFWVMPRARGLRAGAEVAEMVRDFQVGVFGALSIYQVVWKYSNTLTAG